jgi:hypothetical protein
MYEYLPHPAEDEDEPENERCHRLMMVFLFMVVLEHLLQFGFRGFGSRHALVVPLQEQLFFRLLLIFPWNIFGIGVKRNVVSKKIVLSDARSTLNKEVRLV